MGSIKFRFSIAAVTLVANILTYLGLIALAVGLVSTGGVRVIGLTTSVLMFVWGAGILFWFVVPAVIAFVWRPRNKGVFLAILIVNIVLAILVLVLTGRGSYAV